MKLFILLTHLIPLSLSVDPLVDLTYRKYIGQPLPNNITQWLGIRYAAPPTGSRRFKPPRDPIHKPLPELAITPGKTCLSTSIPPEGILTSEDCLFLSVHAPSHATPLSKLPVYVYIQGGGFAKNADPHLDGSGLVTASNHSIIFVTFNYRVGVFGFLSWPGTDDIKANNGLRDQIKALEWVRKYIHLFGGDRDKVVLGGASAGGSSVVYHMMRGNWTEKPLFRGVVVSSVAFGTVLTQREAGYQFENLVAKVGCAVEEPVACLRNMTARELVKSEETVPFPGAGERPLYMWGPVVDGEVVKEGPFSAFRGGRVVQVPAVFGVVTNDGTRFAPKGLRDRGGANGFLRDQFPGVGVRQLARLNRLYPNRNGSCPEEGCWWRQASDVYGELRYVCPSLFVTTRLRGLGVKRVFGYRWDVEDPVQMGSGLGVPHTVEVNAIFGPENVNGSAPVSYYRNGTNAGAVEAVQGYWASFIRTLDPNRYRLAGSAKWETWDGGDKGRLLFGTGGHTGMESIDDDLAERCEYWESIAADLSQ